jgi:hypothetical protein
LAVVAAAAPMVAAAVAAEKLRRQLELWVQLTFQFPSLSVVVGPERSILQPLQLQQTQDLMVVSLQCRQMELPIALVVASWQAVTQVQQIMRLLVLAELTSLDLPAVMSVKAVETLLKSLAVLVGSAMTA